MRVHFGREQKEAFVKLTSLVDSPLSRAEYYTQGYLPAREWFGAGQSIASGETS